MSNNDEIVVGAGNAAQAAAMSALENGAKKVAILENSTDLHFCINKSFFSKSNL